MNTVHFEKLDCRVSKEVESLYYQKPKGVHVAQLFDGILCFEVFITKRSKGLHVEQLVSNV